MPLPLILGLLSAIPGIAGGIIANSQHRKYADLLGDSLLKMPEEMGNAEDIYRMIAGREMPGYDIAKGNIEQTIPLSMYEAKQAVDSPSAILGLLEKEQGNVADQMRQLEIANAAEKNKSEYLLANFLSGVKGPMAMNIQQQNMGAKLGAQAERMMGTKELLGGITQGVGSGISAWGMGKYLDYVTGQQTDWDRFMKNSGGGDNSTGIGNPIPDFLKKDYFNPMKMNSDKGEESANIQNTSERNDLFDAILRGYGNNGFGMNFA
jgi:hypothetical protein